VLAKVRVRPALAIVLVSAVALSGCQLFGHKKKADTTYTEQPVEQLYSAGAQKLDQHHWNDAVTYFKEVERQHPYSEWSRRAILMEAFAHYESNDYTDAIADADRFIDLYPGNGSAAYAYYLKAQCYFEQILDVGRDQAATGQSLAAMREVSRRFPHTEYATDARLKIDMINDQLAGKEMNIGRFYLRNGATLAAIGRFKTVIDRYQTTSHTPEALERLVEAYLTLGLIDEAKENAAVLGFNYPGDYWYEAAYGLMTAKGYQPAVKPTKHHHGLFSPTPVAPPEAPPNPVIVSDEAAAQASSSSDEAAPAAKKSYPWWNPLHLGGKGAPPSAPSDVPAAAPSNVPPPAPSDIPPPAPSDVPPPPAPSDAPAPAPSDAPPPAPAAPTS
jgi:outer membrane protein assembly factor BamD